MFPQLCLQYAESQGSLSFQCSGHTLWISLWQFAGYSVPIIISHNKCTLKYNFKVLQMGTRKQMDGWHNFNPISELRATWCPVLFHTIGTDAATLARWGDDDNQTDSRR